MKKSLFAVVMVALCGWNLFSQEAIKSDEDDYYDLLVLNGIVDRPTLNYKTLSDNKYLFAKDAASDFPWAELNLGKSYGVFDWNSNDSNWFVNGFDKSLSYRIYGPEVFASYNSKAPFGQNDGALWQGRGWNASLSAGARLEAFGFELTLKPQLVYSQNKDFDIMPSASSATSEWGYFYGSVDAPQRFGDKAIKDFDWGDSEIRWNYRTFTVGFGTQPIWNGPSWENSVMLSNNAPSFPKFDFGLRKTSLVIPYLEWNLGDVETRFFYGYLTESDFFDEDSSNDHNMLSGITFSYAPSLWLLKGLTLGVTKICLSQWGDSIKQYMNPGFYGNSVGTVLGEDQYASLTADWIFPSVGFELYGELGFDDFLCNGFEFYEYARYPFHTVTYTWGLKKSFTISREKKLYGLFNFEWDNTETSQDYQMWPKSRYNFGFHHQIKQGKTNRGQWLGSGIGYGGNSQVLSFKLFSPHGYDRIFVGRNNPDNNYIWDKTIDVPASSNVKYFASFKANFYLGAETMWYILPNFSVSGGFLYNLIINPFYEAAEEYEEFPGYLNYQKKSYWNNYRFTLKAKYTL